MSVRVGIIGVGAIGLDHIARLRQRVSGARVVAIADVDLARTDAVVKDLPEVRAPATGRDLIREPDVDAVVVASWGPTHEEFVLGALEAGKDVFCEKPLAPTPDACQRIVNAELAHGRRRVQVGFMRRYDAGYRALKAALDDGVVGAPLLAHCAHRNPAAPPYGFTSDMIISDSAVHDIDIARWLFGQEITAVSVLKPRPAANDSGLQDPLFVILETAEGAIVDVELFVNCGYGYDVRCEVVAETGTLALGDGSEVVVRRTGQRSDAVPVDWRARFAGAYDTELQAWVDAVAAGTATGPSAWDGYAAAVVSDLALAALESGQRVAVDMPPRPDFYRGENEDS